MPACLQLMLLLFSQYISTAESHAALTYSMPHVVKMLEYVTLGEGKQKQVEHQRAVAGECIAAKLLNLPSVLGML